MSLVKNAYFHNHCQFSLEVESNGINFELIIVEFFELFFTFLINRIINFRIERISDKSSIWKIWLHPIVGVESNLTNFELIFIEFFEHFLPFRINRIANVRIGGISNEFKFDSTPTLLDFEVSVGFRQHSQLVVHYIFFSLLLTTFFLSFQF